MINEASISRYITETFDRVETANNFGYTFFFYGADHKMPFATLASSDNEYDRVSNLDRPGVFRLNIGVSKTTFQTLFGTGPIEITRFNFTELDAVMPHPQYAAQNFVCVLNPSDTTWERVRGMLTEGYDIAKKRNERRLK